MDNGRIDVHFNRLDTTAKATFLAYDVKEVIKGV